MNYTRHIIPYPKPGCPEGEDIIFIKDNIYVLIDGVSGSSHRKGPKKKWKQCRDFILKFKETFLKIEHDTLQKMVKLSLINTAVKYRHLQGTFVFVVCRITNYLLEYCTLGDSSLFVVRNRKVALHPKHTYINKSHNVPAQIGFIHNRINWTKCVSKIFRLLPNDYIIMCSDGVTDNLTVDNIIKYPFAKLLCHNAKQAGVKNDDISSICIQI